MNNLRLQGGNDMSNRSELRTGIRRALLSFGAAVAIASAAGAAQAADWRGWNIHAAGYPNTVAMDKFAELLD